MRGTVQLVNLTLTLFQMLGTEEGVGKMQRKDK